MARTRVAIIGAGSGAFSLAMIKDLCLTKDLAGSEVSLMDIDPQRLDAAYSVCTRYAKELGAELSIEKTVDRRQCLRGAEFVINTALAAPHERLRAGWELAARRGFRLGGSYHVMYDEAFWVNYYQLALMESITKDMLELCPGAWHLMVANPVITGVTYLTRRFPQAKVVGLCHGYSHIFTIAEDLGLDPASVSFEIPGVNHFVWLNRFRFQGRDAFPILDRWIESQAEEYWRREQHPAIRRKAVDLYKRFGVFPIGDTSAWSGASWPWWYHDSEETERSWGEQPMDGWNDYFSSVARAAAGFRALLADGSRRVTEVYPPVLSGEPMIPLVESIACDKPRVHVVNVANTRHFVPGVPADFEVEIPALCSGSGVQGIAVDPLPDRVLQHILRDRVATVNLELEAHQTGRRDILAELVMTDPWARSRAQAEALIDDIFALPYHDDLRCHYPS